MSLFAEDQQMSWVEQFKMSDIKILRLNLSSPSQSFSKRFFIFSENTMDLLSSWSFSLSAQADRETDLDIWTFFE